MRRVTPIGKADPPGYRAPKPKPQLGTATTVGKPMSMVTPSPKSHSNDAYTYGRTNTNTNTDDAINDDENEAWRKHGKVFRANIVHADESNGGNAFALSDSCGIERYYRVADRVLEQFLSSNIAERNELIETYLVGNRLFKFLSVVLPTHHQYFSLDSKLEELRNQSESQLMELLDYIEELELLIDEMEYNKYILNDLTPPPLSGQYNNTNGGHNKLSHDTNERSSFDSSSNNNNGDTHGEFREGFNNRHDVDGNSSSNNNNNNNNNNNEMNGANSDLQEQMDIDQERFSQEERNFRFGNVKTAVQAIEAYNQRQKQERMMKERVAAVLTGGSSSDFSIHSGRSIHSLSGVGGVTRSVSSSFTRNNDSRRLDFIPEKIEVNANNNAHTHANNNNNNNAHNRKPRGFSPLETEFMGNDELIQHLRTNSNSPEMIPRKSSGHEEEKHDSHGESPVPWDADFSRFDGVPSSDTTRDFEGFGEKKTHIDLLLEDDHSSPQQQQQQQQQQQHAGKPKLVPRIREPPVSYSRDVRAHAQDQVARLPSLYDVAKTKNTASSSSAAAVSGSCSTSDIFYALEDPRFEARAAPVKTKIEERMERADPSKRSHFDRQVHPEDSSLVETHSHRKLLHQFRGCVRSLLD